LTPELSISLNCMYEFKWIAWNLAKIAMHNVTVAEAEHVVNHPDRGYPRNTDGK
jgi:hypothetical protein